jgi:hypothetical protein
MKDVLIPELKEKIVNMSLTQEDIDKLNAVGHEARDRFLKEIPQSEEILCELCIDEDINGDLFFVKS